MSAPRPFPCRAYILESLRGAVLSTPAFLQLLSVDCGFLTGLRWTVASAPSLSSCPRQPGCAEQPSTQSLFKSAGMSSENPQNRRGPPNALVILVDAVAAHGRGSWRGSALAPWPSPAYCAVCGSNSRGPGRFLPAARIEAQAENGGWGTQTVPECPVRPLRR